MSDTEERITPTTASADLADGQHDAD